MCSDKREMLTDNPTFVGKVCETKNSRSLLQYFLTLGVEDGEVEKRTKEIFEDNNTTRYTANKYVDIFIKVGIIERRGERNYIRYVPLPESEPFQKLVEVDEVLRERANKYLSDDIGAALCDLYGGESRRILADFFIKLGVETDDYELMTKSGVYDKTGVARNTVSENIDTLVEYEVIEENNERGYPRYKPNVNSETFNALKRANIELIEAYDE